MEDFNRTVKNFLGILKNCNADQRSVANEVLETFSTFIDEILLVFKKRGGLSYTNNVNQLLFEDLVDISRHFQSEQHEKMISCLSRLQKSKEDFLRRLHRTITMCTGNLQVAEEEMFGKKMKEEEKLDLIDFLSVSTNIIKGIMESNPNDKYLKGLVERMKEHRRTYSYHGKDMDVEEINESNLSEMIVRNIGHKGIVEKSGLRYLLQTCIDFLQTEPKEFWKNASITIYDEDDNMYKIASGMRKHQFTCRMKNGEPFISETTSFSEHTKPKQNHKASTDTKYNPSEKMENFEQTVMNFFQTLEACSAEQRSFANEVLRSFSTFVEEELLAFHITVGSSDTINVKQLLFEDLVNISHHLQLEQHENVISYLRRLQETKTDHLGSLHRTIAMCGNNLQVAEREVLQKKMKEQERKDLVEFLTMTTNIIQGIIASNPNDSYMKSLVERMKKHRGTFSFKDKVMDVEEINKRHLGKMIVRYIGHEGIVEKSGLRRLLQACIDFLQTEPEEFWKNASITIYDEDDNMYKIASGTKKHQFICRMKNGEPFIKEKTSFSEHQETKPNHKMSAEITDDSSHKRHNPSEKGHDQSCSVS